MLHRREVADRELPGLVDGVEDVGKICDELLFLGILAEERGHFGSEGGDYIGVHLCQAGPLDHVVESADGVGAWE